jgi:hypothetical protein
MYSRTVCVCAAVVVVWTGLTGRAQEDQPADQRKLAILDPADAGPDFADQGEYAGSVFMRDGNRWLSRSCGLQVSAQGDGRFLASLYQGGLPGAGATRADRVTLEGTRTAAGVELQGDGTYITLAAGTARLASSSRQMVGELRKTRRQSPTLGLRPPAGAIVLFDGTSTDRLTDGRRTSDGLLMEGAEFDTPCRDFTLHVEYRLPYMPYARGQGRANSGVYLQSRYEVQILDSFALEGAENECGALYRQRRPAVNASYPPLAWQTYDVDFTSPRFDANGTKVRNARLTVRHNGTLIHNNIEVAAKTGAGAPEGARLLPTKLQDHGNPVRFRNIWLVDRERATQYVGTDAPAGDIPRGMVWGSPGVRLHSAGSSGSWSSRTTGSWSSAPAGSWSSAPAGSWSSAPAGTWSSASVGNRFLSPTAHDIPSLPPYYYPEPQFRPWWEGQPSAPFHPGLYEPYYRNFGPQYGIPVSGVGAW